MLVAIMNRKDENKKATALGLLPLLIPWQRPIFPESCPFSIVGAEAFHCRVRDGNGWVHLACVTKKPSLV